MCAVLDTADEQDSVVVEYPEGDAVIAAARDPPSREFVPQRFGQPVRILRQRCGAELDNRRSDLVRQPIQSSDGGRREPNCPGWCIIGHDSP